MSEASKNALQRGMTPTHELMVDWILENPGGTLRQMGDYFGYSVSWLSTMMHSDAFKAYTAERLKEVHAAVTQDIPTRMRALAEVAIDRMHEVLDKTNDPDTITDSFDKVMHRYGYAPGAQKQNPLSPSFQTNNVFFLSPEQFQQHRETLINAHSNVPQRALPQSAPPQPEPTTVDGTEEISSGD